MPHTRWYCDPGAIPGEALYYLDIPPRASTDYASAAVIEHDAEEGDRFEAIIPALDGFRETAESHTFSTLDDAQRWLESRIPAPLPSYPIDVMPEWWVQDYYTPSPGSGLIMITEPGTPAVTPHGSFAITYHLEAWDVPSTISHPTHGTIAPMTLRDGERLLEFLLRYRNSLRALTVSCHAGISRSPAIAIAISEWIRTAPTTSDLISRYPGFHRPMYRTLCQALTTHGLLAP